MMLTMVVVFAPLTTIATLLRFVARRTQKKVALGLDDLFALLSLLTFGTLIGVSLWGES